jgi:pSer/pThr/pTyr-binding forkhead associated (FHA) protein
MARLLIKTEGLPNRTLELRMGANRIGRTLEDNDFAIPHSTISSLHCEIVVTNEGVYLRDCESTNGSFIDGEPVTEAVWLQAGQEIRLGDVELFVESTEVNIYIPEYDRSVPVVKPPTVLPDGTLCCPRHPETPAIFRCTNCGEVMCQSCIHIMKRQGGAPLFLCKVCSHKCERITVSASQKSQKKKGLLSFLQETVRLKLGHSKDAPKK